MILREHRTNCASFQIAFAHCISTAHARRDLGTVWPPDSLAPLNYHYSALGVCQSIFPRNSQTTQPLLAHTL